MPLIITDACSRDYCMAIIEGSRFNYEILIVEFLNGEDFLVCHSQLQSNYITFLEESLKLVNQFSGSIRELKLNIKDPVEFEHVKRLFMILPHVEKLIVQNIKFIDEGFLKYNEERQILPNLKTLEYLSENPQIFKLLRNNSIEHFDCYCGDTKSIWKFVRVQNLKSVVLWKDVFYQNRIHLNPTIESMIINVQMSFPSISFLFAFKSLRGLEKLVYAANNPTIDIRIFETIFNELTNLKDIYLNITDETFGGNNAIIQEYLERGPENVGTRVYQQVADLLKVNLEAYFSLVRRNDELLNVWIEGDERFNHDIGQFIEKYKRDLFALMDGQTINLTKFIIMFFGPFEDSQLYINRMHRILADTFFQFIRVTPRTFRINFSALTDWLDQPVALPNHHQHFVFRGQIIQATEKLALHGRNTTENLQNIIKIYPNLKTLKLLKQSNIADELLHFLASYLDLVENLTLEFSEGKNIKWEGSIQFRSLKKLHIKCFSLGADAFLNFFKQNRMIEELILEGSKIDDTVLEEVAKNLENLKHLEIIGVNNLTDHAVDLLVDNARNLKCLHIKRKSFQPFSNYKRLFEKSGLKLYYNVQN